MLHKLSIALTNNLIKTSHLRIDADQQEVYIYGLECLLNSSITITILFLWGASTHSLLITVVWLIAFTLLRHYAGGYHAPTNFACISSTVLLGSSTYIFTYIPIKHYTVLYFIMILLCLLFAPAKEHRGKYLLRHDGYYKSLCICILLFGYFLHYFLPIEISLAYTYAFICCLILMLIDMIKNAKKATPL